MRFIAGSKLTNEMRRLAGSRVQTKIAIAYWGEKALQLLKLTPSRSNLQVLCCLKGGKSAPQVIRKFGKRAKQNNRLHAKVIWTPTEAIVGSANASSNGMPEEENAAVGLIEAGLLIDDQKQLSKISAWFDNAYGLANSITPCDLKAAQAARNKRIGGFGSIVPELIEIPLGELKKKKIGVLLWSVELSRAERERIEELEEKPPFDDLDYYLDLPHHAPQYPYGYDCLVFRASVKRGRLQEFQGFQHFDPQSNWPPVESDDGRTAFVIWARELRKSKKDTWELAGLPPFRVSKNSEAAIRQQLLKRRLRLKHDMVDKGWGGFISWEPLHKLLES